VGLSITQIDLSSGIGVVIDGSAFVRSSIEEILVDGANPHYCVSGQFLIALERMTLIRYFGHAEGLGLDMQCEIPESFELKIDVIDHLTGRTNQGSSELTIEPFRWHSGRNDVRKRDEVIY
jgi:hypothetical protein